MGDDAVFIRDPQPDLGEYFGSSYASDVDLPASAVDTGYSDGEDHLWLSADEQIAYVGSVDSAEAWPRTVQNLGCA